jgi:predicted porin
MKKSLLAFAALAAISGAASAQSNVTIYGVADVGFQRTDSDAAGVRPTWAMASGIWSGSRIGFRGTEDLGGGLAAIFQLENGFAIDTGAFGSANTLFNRQAFVGLKGGFGTVTLGRQYSALHIAVDTIDPFETGLAGDATGPFGNLTGYPIRVNNSIVYALPNVMAGVTGSVQYGFGEVAGDFSANRAIGAGLGYANGPLNVQFAYHTTNTTAATPRTDADANIAFLGAKYNFGFATLHAAYADKEIDSNLIGGATTKARNYMVGATVPVGVGSVLASWNRTDYRTTNANADQYAIGYIHPLSKRTNLYTSYGRTNNDAVVGADANVFNVGVRHRF